MTSALSTLLACSMLSCATVGVFADDGRPTTGQTGPLTRSNGNSGNNNSNNNDDGSFGERDHGFHGDRWQDRVPRTPMWQIHTFTGVRDSPVHPEGNSRGIATWWRGEHAVDELLARIQQGYDYGARWFFINRPMGTPGYTHVPGASWLTLEDEKREALPERLADALLDHFADPVHIVWFIGSDMTDPRNFEGWTGNERINYYGLGENDTWEELIGTRMTIGGWLSTGASGLVIDHSCSDRERDHYIRLAQALGQFPFNLNIYGEAFPVEWTDDGRKRRDANNSLILHDESITSMPWIGSDRYFDVAWPEETRSSNFPVDTDNTRLFIWLDRSALNYGNEDTRRDLVNEYMDLGLIPITNDRVMFTEALNRLGDGNSASSASTARDNSGGNSNSSSNRRAPIIRRSTVNGARRSMPTNTNSVPEQELPERYQKSGTGVR